MGDFTVGWLGFLLLVALLLSAFFAASETALMSVSRQRLRHLAREGRSAARMAEELLERPDRLVGTIMLCGTFVKVAAVALTTAIALPLGGAPLAALGVALLTIVLIILGELAPRTVGALYPERVALPAAVVCSVLARVLSPFVAVTNWLAHGALRLFGVTRNTADQRALSNEELRTIVAEASTVIPHRHQRMLMSILDLERTTVEDIMVPRHEIYAIDVTDDWDDIVEKIRECRHTRIPVYEGQLESLIGVLHMKKLVRLLSRGELDRDQLIALARTREPYYVPEGTLLNTQLLQFQRQRRRVAFVVDEYGDVQGLITLEDLLEEIVGEFSSDTSLLHLDVHRERNDSFVVNATASVRTLNRKMGWELPTTGPKTLNGLIIEQMETIPSPGERLRIGDYSLEVLQVTDNAVKTVRLQPVVASQLDKR